MDISVVLNAHDEGVLANATCASVEMAIADAEKAGLAVELIVVLDRPDDRTRDFFHERRSPSWRIIERQFGDCGLARNAGAGIATGDWIAFQDADDLFGRNWLTKAYRAAICDNRLIVWHPQTNICFGAGNDHIANHIDMESPDFDPVRMICENYWTARCFAPRDLFEKVPFTASRHDRQIGFEDWGWNLDVVAFGAIHKVVSGTAHFIRQKRAGLNKFSHAQGCMTKPTDYFRQMLAARSCAAPPR